MAANNTAPGSCRQPHQQRPPADAFAPVQILIDGIALRLL